MRYIYTSVFVFFFSFSFLISQVPNAGFETWANGDPVGWFTYDFLGDAVTQTSDSHSGSSAAKMQITDFFSTPLPPILISGQFGVSEKFGSLTGYFKFIPINANQALSVTILLSKGSNYIGGGAWETFQATSAYTQFVVPIEYSTAEVPDSAYIQIAVFDSSGVGTGGIGAYAIVDDLSLGGPTDVKDNYTTVNSFELGQNYPNPFNPSTTIRYALPFESKVAITVYNLLGQEVATLVNDVKSSGYHEVVFNASSLSSGVYLYRINAVSSTGSKEFSSTKKLILLK